MKKLSSRQLRILDFIQQYQGENGYPPTVREIADAVGLASVSTAHGHLERMERKGYIRRNPERPRALEVVTDEEKEPFDPRRIPILTSPKKHSTDWFILPRKEVGDKDVFMISVSDNKMFAAGIHQGDLVIVERDTFEDGDIVLALSKERYIVRRLYNDTGYPVLETESGAEQEEITRGARIVGKVIGMFRKISDAS
jgi:repressor LexA